MPVQVSKIKAKVKVGVGVGVGAGADVSSKAPNACRIWTQTDSCYHSLIDIIDGPIAAFDLDGTLMKEHSCELIPETIKYAKKCRDDGMQLVVMSNQYGVTKGHTTHADIRGRFDILGAVFDDRISFIYASDKDKYRKPMTGMFDLIRATHNISGGIYCGDAIGRAGDFAVSDLHFAQNCGLECRRPIDGLRVDHQLASKFRFYDKLYPFDKWIGNGDGILQTLVPSDPTIIIIVGPQASGKSYLSKMLALRYPGRFVVLNRDTIGKMVESEFRLQIKARRNIILDNTNYDKVKRMDFISLAKKESYAVKIVHFDIPKDLCLHMCHMRVQLGGPRIPPVAIHTYYKRLISPTDDEGDIIRINDILSYVQCPINKQILPQFYFHYDLKDR